MTSPAPYGPSTQAIRRFLVRLAALDEKARDEIVARFDSVSRTRAFAAADAVLGESIERAGRLTERDALAGPLLQIVSKRDMLPDDGTEQQPELHPIAEPALAALLALLAADVLPARHLDALYSPFEPAIPRATLAD